MKGCLQEGIAALDFSQIVLDFPDKPLIENALGHICFGPFFTATSLVSWQPCLEACIGHIIEETGLARTNCVDRRISEAEVDSHFCGLLIREDLVKMSELAKKHIDFRSASVGILPHAKLSMVMNSVLTELAADPDHDGFVFGCLQHSLESAAPLPPPPPNWSRSS